MRTVTQALLATFILAGTAAWGAPYIGYCYPAGGQQGTTIRVHLGGQRLMHVKNVLVSGAGVHGAFVSFEGAEGPLNGIQRAYLREVIENLKKSTPPAMPATPPAMPERPKITLPDLPDLRDLEQKSPQELNTLLVKYVYTQKKTKPPLAEDVILEVTIAPDAVPGNRELRVITPGGLSNPMVFQVGSLPEVLEKDRSAENAVGPPRRWRRPCSTARSCPAKWTASP